jgi:membrane protease YdiL (CAAX protease family)
MAITLTPAKGIGGALLLVIVGVACHLIVPMTSPNPIMQALQSAIGIAGCIVALLGMGAFDMINPTTDAIKRAKLQLPGIFKPIVITTAIALAIRFAFNAPSAIATIANIPYYLAYYVHGAIFEECLFRVAILLILVRWCDSHGKGVIGAVVLSTIIFVIPHASTGYLFNGATMFTGIVQLVTTALLGYCTAVMTIRTDSILAAITLHFGTNLLLAIGCGAYLTSVNQPFSSAYDIICAIIINIVTAVALNRWRQKNPIY